MEIVSDSVLAGALEHHSQAVAFPSIYDSDHVINPKSLGLAPTLSRAFTAQLGSQRERVVGEFGSSFGGNGAEFFPLISG